VRVAYVTNRPGVDTRMMLRALESDDRIEVLPDVAVTGSLGNWGQSRQRTRNEERVTRNAPQADVFVLDDVVETGSPAVWQTIAGQVRAGAGLLVLAGPDFQPGPNVGGLLEGTAGRAQTGTFTPELAAEGRVMPWWGTAGGARDVGRGARGEQIRSHDGRDVIDLARVPPFAGLMPLTGANRQSPIANRQSLWLVAQENEVPLIVAGKAGKGRFVYVAGYPLWRWGFGPEANPDQGTPLSVFTTGVMRYLAERDTSPFRLQTDETDLYRGQPVRLVMKAVAPDGRPWTGLSAMVQVVAVSVDSGTGTNPESRDQNPELGTQAQKPETVAVPMTETGGGVYEATIEALAPGRYRAVATVENGDSPSEETGDSPSERLRRTRRGTVPSFLGKAATEFVVAEQAVELASTGMNEGLLRAISEASGGRFFVSDSLPREGNGIALGSYQRRFTFDPRRAVWAYVLIALLAGAEWLLRRRRGML